MRMKVVLGDGREDGDLTRALNERGAVVIPPDAHVELAATSADPELDRACEEAFALAASLR